MVSRLTGPGVSIALAGNGSLFDLSDGQNVHVGEDIQLVGLVIFKNKMLGIK